MRKYFGPLMAVMELLIGTALTAAAFGLLIVPQGFAAGGVTGLSSILARIVPVPLPVVVFVVNMGLLLLGLVFVGRNFVAKTISVSILFPAMLAFFSRYAPDSAAQDPILCAAAAGVMLGIGSGLVLHSGASSGGFDILAVILNKRFQIPVAAVMNVCDATVILTQSMHQPLNQTIYGILVITISAAIVGRIVTLGAAEIRSVPRRRCTLSR